MSQSSRNGNARIGCGCSWETADRGLRANPRYPRINASKGTSWVPNRYRTVQVPSGLDPFVATRYYRSMKADSQRPLGAALMTTRLAVAAEKRLAERRGLVPGRW